MPDSPPPIPPLPVPASDSAPEPEPDPAPVAPNPWIARALATAAGLGLAADYLIFDHSTGVGWAIFILALVLAIGANRATAPSGPRLAVLAVLVFTTVGQTILRPSATGTLVAILLAAYAAATFLSAQHFPFVRTLLEGITKILAAPLRPFQSVRHAGTVRQAIRATAAPLTKQGAGTRRYLSIILPAALVVLPFVVFLSLGNRILGDAFSRLFAHLGEEFYAYEFPSIARVGFVIAVATLTLALLWRTKPSRALSRITAALEKTFAGPADHAVAHWRTVLILGGVNAVFFTANTLDVIYLWADTALPEHLTLAEFVHQGTANLIISVLTAAAVLSLLFQQNPAITRSRITRHLAIAWIVQNLFLASSVALRNFKYIVDGYGLSLERLYLFFFLALVAVGFLILAVRVLREKTFAWLVGANLTTLFALAFATQFWDARAFVAEKNFELAQQWKTTHVNHLYIDTHHLADLGPSAWPTLIKIAGGAENFDDNEISNARSRLDEIAKAQLSTDSALPWQSFSLHRQQTLAALRDYLTLSHTTAQN
jgi:hypothetical protein